MVTETKEPKKTNHGKTKECQICHKRKQLKKVKGKFICEDCLKDRE